MRERYILFNTIPEREDDVLCELMKRSELKDICFLFGEYDLLAIMETENETDPSEVREDMMKKIPGIEDIKLINIDT